MIDTYRGDRRHEHAERRPARLHLGRTTRAKLTHTPPLTRATSTFGNTSLGAPLKGTRSSYGGLQGWGATPFAGAAARGERPHGRGGGEAEEEVASPPIVAPMGTPSPPPPKSNRSNITPDAFAQIGLFDDSQCDLFAQARPRATVVCGLQQVGGEGAPDGVGRALREGGDLRELVGVCCEQRREE